MTTARDTLECADLLNARLNQASAILHTLSAEEHHSILDKHLVSSTLWATQELLAQAKQAADDLWSSIKEAGDNHAPGQSGQ